MLSSDPALEHLLKQEVTDYASFDLLKTRTDDLLSTVAALALALGVVVALLTVMVIAPNTGTPLHDVAARATAFIAFAILVVASFAMRPAVTPQVRMRSTSRRTSSDAS